MWVKIVYQIWQIGSFDNIQKSNFGGMAKKKLLEWLSFLEDGYRNDSEITC